MRSNIGDNALPMMCPGRITEAVGLPMHETDGNLRIDHGLQHVRVGLTTGNVINEGCAGRNGSGCHARPHGVHGRDNARPTQFFDDWDNARMFDLFGHTHRPWPSGFAPHINEVRTRITQRECVFDSFVEVNIAPTIREGILGHIENPHHLGATTRLFEHLFTLIETGLLELPILYLSGHIVRHKDEYYSLLNAVTRSDDWEPWILFMLTGVESTARWTLALVEATDGLRGTVEHDIRRLRPKLPAGELTRLLFTQPYLRIENVVDAGLAQRQTASKWLNELATTGLIAKEKIGRNVVYINQKLLNELFTTPLPE